MNILCKYGGRNQWCHRKSPKPIQLKNSYFISDVSECIGYIWVLYSWIIRKAVFDRHCKHGGRNQRFPIKSPKPIYLQKQFHVYKLLWRNKNDLPSICLIGWTTTSRKCASYYCRHLLYRSVLFFQTSKDKLLKSWV